ncbi:amidohydrolase family protein [Candidatus Micrarchaeota archaeon]|nr:amidohydrolase family protein [Candidatus Micrarchaeota archaeon]
MIPAGFDYELTELHTHIGSAVSPEIMWSLAHSQGIKVRDAHDYWKFVEAITVQPGKIKRLDDYLELFNITELIQSSPEGMEKSAHSIVGGAYRKNLITRLEIRFNPMLRNRGGERDLDHIILATIRGVEKAMLEYPVKAALILMLDRRFRKEQNAIIVEKAIKYKNRGIVGIDVGGPQAQDFKMSDLSDLFDNARKAGLGITAHAGEDDERDIQTVIEALGVQRIGHGVQSAWHPNLLKLIRDRNITLEICPSSNLETKSLKTIDELRFVLKKLLEEDIKFTINTDGPEMLNTSLKKERAFLLREGLLNEEQLRECEENARKASFLK